MSLRDPNSSHAHVDLVAHDPLSARPSRLIQRTQRSDPKVVEAARDGSAIYVYLSEPHTMAGCPFGPGDEIERAVGPGRFRTVRLLRAFVGLVRAGVSPWCLRACRPFVVAAIDRPELV